MRWRSSGREGRSRSCASSSSILSRYAVIGHGRDASVTRLVRLWDHKENEVKRDSGAKQKDSKRQAWRRERRKTR